MITNQNKMSMVKGHLDESRAANLMVVDLTTVTTVILNKAVEYRRSKCRRTRMNLLETEDWFGVKINIISTE